MTHAEIVRKLIGEIMPIGESTTDKKRLENLQDMTSLVSILVEDICKVARKSGAPEHSINHAAGFANRFLLHELEIKEI